MRASLLHDRLGVADKKSHWEEIRASLPHKGLEATNITFVRTLERKTSGKELFYLQAIDVFTYFIKAIAQIIVRDFIEISAQSRKS